MNNTKVENTNTEQKYNEEDESYYYNKALKISTKTGIQSF